MVDTLRITLAQVNQSVGDLSGNAAAMRRILADLPAGDMEKMVIRQ